MLRGGAAELSLMGEPEYHIAPPGRRVVGSTRKPCVVRAQDVRLETAHGERAHLGSAPESWMREQAPYVNIARGAKLVLLFRSRGGGTT